MKMNNKGFSMVEILAVVVILGVLSTIGIVSVTKLIENSRKHYYEAQSDQLVLAAQSYANDNKNILPKNIGGTHTIYLKELIDKKYIKEDIVDKNKVPCYTEDQEVDGKKVKGSRVDIYKSSKNEYKYIGYLECNECQKENEKDGDYSCSDKNKEEKPKISISMIKLDSKSQGNVIYNDSHKINITIDAVEKKTGYDQSVKISSYSYKIYVNGIVKLNSGLKINNKKDQIKIEEQLNKYTPGKVTVKVTVTNTLGQTVTKSKSEDYKDAQLPACSYVTYEGKYAMKNYDAAVVTDLETLVCGTPKQYEWLGLNHDPSSRQAWVLCNDKLGVGCAQHEYSINMVTEGHKQSLTMQDKSGNPRTCTIKKCIDKTTPKIVVKVKNGSKVNYTYTKNPSTTNGKYTTSDKNKVWLNKANYPNGVTVEVTVSDPPASDEPTKQLSNLKSFVWKQNPKNKKENQEGEATLTMDSQTWAWNANQKSYTKSINITEDGVRKIVFTAIDHAGNEHTYTLILKIDRTPPQQPSIKMYKEDKKTGKSTKTKYSSDKWTEKYVWVKTNEPKDKPDVSGWKTNRYKTRGTVGKQKDITGNDLHVNTQGISYVTFQSCDHADNCSTYVSPEQIIKEDRTNPVITYTVTSSGGTYGSSYKNYVNISVSCSDSYSGVKTFKVGGKKVSNPKSYSKSKRGTLSKSAYCKDNVGNDSSKSGSFRVVKEGTSCRYCSCTSYNYYWYVCTNGYSGALVDCKNPATYGGASCGPNNLGIAQAVSANLRAECKRSCTGCGPCWY